MFAKGTLRRAIEKAGGSAAVAKRFGIARQAVHRWRRCPPERVIGLAQMAGMRRSDLRPDLYPERMEVAE